VILSDIRQDILDGYLFVQFELAQELQKAGSQVNVEGEKTNVQGLERRRHCYCVPGEISAYKEFSLSIADHPAGVFP
jgi:hypothetical protein